MSYYKSSASFMKQMVELYKSKDHKSISIELKGLFDHADTRPKEEWLSTFDFSPFTKIDNICGIYFNILEALQQWEVERVSGRESKSQSFDSYLLVLEMSLAYLDNMSKNNFWFAACIKYLVLKSKFAMKQANNAGSDNITKTKSLERLVQILRDFKSSNNIDDEIKKSFKLMINNLLVSCYLNIRDYTKSKMIIDDRQIIRELSSFSQPEINNYQFQAARLEIYNKTIQKAIQSLQSIKFTTNRQRKLILKYLIPCNLYAWKIPKIDLYPEYTLLSQAIVSGNFANFQKNSEKYKVVWIKRGIYYLILGLEVLVWRNFLKRVQRYAECDTMSISRIAEISKLAGGNFSAEDCLFHIINLIEKSYLRGHIYISNGQKTLVFRVKKGDVFPKTKPT